jgi:sterol desaturase/sphingolipid hydroxylase (fatty acid hydroxylase superfamily)
VDRFLSFLKLCANSIYHGTIVIAIAFVLFSLMERLFSFNSVRKPWRATLLDLQYALLSMLYPPFITFILAIIFGYLAMRIKDTPHDPHISAPSFAIQLLMVLFARDCLIYLRHRLFHTRPVWAFHSVHHSSEEVNWLSAVRFHPAENIIESAGEIALFICADVLGADPAVLSVVGLTVGFYNLFIHSNLRWKFGPLRYVLVSPVFHRWHHSDTPDAQDKNFAAMFSCIDLVLGTYYMPMHLTPDTTGISGQERTTHPRTLAGQLWYPFKKR